MQQIQYLHVKKVETYHPGYKDRPLRWCKADFKMINADPEFMCLDEIDKWRFLAFIMIELQMQKPVPLTDKFLVQKGFDFKKRPLSLTLKMLHTFVELRNESVTESLRPITPEEQAKIDQEKAWNDNLEIEFSKLWLQYPKAVGKKKAWEHYRASVKTPEDIQDCATALTKYKSSPEVGRSFIKNGATWFNEWRDWLYYEPTKAGQSDGVPDKWKTSSPRR